MLAVYMDGVFIVNNFNEDTIEYFKNQNMLYNLSQEQYDDLSNHNKIIDKINYVGLIKHNDKYVIADTVPSRILDCWMESDDFVNNHYINVKRDKYDKLQLLGLIITYDDM